jgi:Cu/Ag efflux protein CusF
MSHCAPQHTMHRTTRRLMPHLRAALLALGVLGAATAFAGDDHDHGEAHDSAAAPTQVASSQAPATVPAAVPAAASTTVQATPGTGTGTGTGSGTETAAELSEGEVLRWDARSSKVTLRHGPIANLGMPPMTMVFKVQNADQGSALQPGMKVRFKAEQLQGAYVLTHIAPAQ